MRGGGGQVLYLEHSVESLARGGPWLLGTIAPGISRWRVLKEAETEIHGGSSRRRLYGCTITMIQAQAQLHWQGGSGVGADVLGAAGGPPVFEQLLLTWSQVSAVHHALHRVFRPADCRCCFRRTISTTSVRPSPTVSIRPLLSVMIQPTTIPLHTRRTP